MMAKNKGVTAVVTDGMARDRDGIVAAGLPVLVFWGETNETVWRPRAERVTVLRSPEGLQGLSVERVIEELELFLPKEEFSS